MSGKETVGRITQLSKWRWLLNLSTCKGLTEGSRSSAGILVSGGVTLGLKHLRTGLYFHILFALHSCKRFKSKEEMGPRSLGSCVRGSPVRCLLLILPVGIGLGRNLWGICYLACPSGDIYLFINLFYEDFTGYTVQFLTDQSLFSLQTMT